YGLDDEVEGSRPHGRHCSLDPALGRLHDHGCIDAFLAQPLHDLDAVHARHHEVEHDRPQAGCAALFQGFERHGAAVREHRSIAEPAHGLIEKAALHRVIINDQDGIGHECHSVRKSRQAMRLRTGTLWHRLLNRHSRNPVNDFLISPQTGSQVREHLMAQDQNRSGQMRHATADAASRGAHKPLDLGVLPEWNLADLYPSMDAPELAADLERASQEALAFEKTWKGRLAEEAGKGAEGRLGEALQAYEALVELFGRIGSYAGLIYAGDTSDPKRAKFYGDVQEKLTDASTHLLFFTLELNKIDDPLIDKALEDDPLFGRYRPWVLDVRKDRPHQLEDRIEQLFHETSVTGRGAWNRLFDETMTSLRFTVDGEELTLEPTLNLLEDPDGEKRRKAAEA